MDVPELQTPRCVLTLLRLENAEVSLAYRLRYADHLSLWEPARDPAEGTLQHSQRQSAAAPGF